MDTFATCMNAVLPLFILMAVGFVTRRAGVLDRDDVPMMNRVCFNVFLSTMAFRSVYTSDFSTAMNPSLLGFVAVAVIAVFALADVFVRVTGWRPEVQGVMAQGIARSNFVMLGFAVAQNLLPNGDLGPIAVLMAVVVPLYNVLGVMVLSVHGSSGADWKGVSKKIATNPLIIATLLALTLVALDVRLPDVVEKCVDQVAAVATPLALFLLGAFFEFGSLAAYRRELAAVCVGRLVVVPLLTIAAGVAAGFGQTALVALIAVFASPTATASFPMAQQMGGDADLAGSIVACTSALCPATIFAFSFVLMSLGLI